MSREFRRSNLNKWTRNIEILKYRNIEIQKYILLYYIYTHIVSILHYIIRLQKNKSQLSSGPPRWSLGHAWPCFIWLFESIGLFDSSPRFESWGRGTMLGNSGEVGREITGKSVLARQEELFHIRFGNSCHMFLQYLAMLHVDIKHWFARIRKKRTIGQLAEGIIVCVPLMLYAWLLQIPNTSSPCGYTLTISDSEVL